MNALGNLNELDSTHGEDHHDLTIRHLEKADLPALEWDGEYTKYRRMYATLYRETRIGRVLMWVIESPSGEIIGQVFVMLYSSERETADGKDRAYVFAFRVKPQWRGKGIGHHLMGFVEDDLRKRGFKLVTLNVAKENLGAISLYERLGYTIIESRPGIWSFKDHRGKVQQVNEPSWRMMKNIRVNR